MTLNLVLFPNFCKSFCYINKIISLLFNLTLTTISNESIKLPKLQGHPKLLDKSKQGKVPEAQSSQSGMTHIKYFKTENFIQSKALPKNCFQIDH